MIWNGLLLLVIQQSCDLKWLTLIGYSIIMWSEMAYSYWLFNNHVIWNGLLLLVIQQSCDLKWLTLIGYSIIMWSEMGYSYWLFNNHVIWNSLLLLLIQQSCDLKMVKLHVSWGGLLKPLLGVILSLLPCAVNIFQFYSNLSPFN